MPPTVRPRTPPRHPKQNLHLTFTPFVSTKGILFILDSPRRRNTKGRRGARGARRGAARCASSGCLPARVADEVAKEVTAEVAEEVVHEDRGCAEGDLFPCRAPSGRRADASVADTQH